MTTLPYATPASTSALNEVPAALQHSPSPTPVQRTYHSASSGRQNKTVASMGPPSKPSSAAAAAAASSSQQSTSAPMPQELRAREEMLVATEQDDIKKMAQRLATRLQYAAFKVERGWTKFSLPEVENLYYKASSGNAVVSSSSSRTIHSSGGKDEVPVSAQSSKRSRRSSRTERVDDNDDDVFGSSSVVPPPSQHSSQVRPAESSAAQQQQTGRNPQQRLQSVIGANGLPTPPPSDGTDLSTSSSAAATKRLNPGVSSRISPTRTMQTLRGEGMDDASTGPNAGSKGASRSTGSYADFWNKLGSSAPSRGGAASAATKVTQVPSEAEDRTTAAAAEEERDSREAEAASLLLLRGRKRPRESAEAEA